MRRAPSRVRRGYVELVAVPMIRSEPGDLRVTCGGSSTHIWFCSVLTSALCLPDDPAHVIPAD
jgi:hypothetical protein